MRVSEYVARTHLRRELLADPRFRQRHFRNPIDTLFVRSVLSIVGSLQIRSHAVHFRFVCMFSVSKKDPRRDYKKKELTSGVFTLPLL